MNTKTGRPEIEVTPAMIEAGCKAAPGFDFRYDDFEYLVSSIYEAMENARLKEAG